MVYAMYRSEGLAEVRQHGLLQGKRRSPGPAVAQGGGDEVDNSWTVCGRSYSGLSTLRRLMLSDVERVCRCVSHGFTGLGRCVMQCHAQGVLSCIMYCRWHVQQQYQKQQQQPEKHEDSRKPCMRKMFGKPRRLGSLRRLGSGSHWAPPAASWAYICATV